MENSLQSKNLVVVDIETTGTNPFVHDALCIALVPMDQSLPSKEIFIRHNSLEWSDFAKKNFDKFRSEWEERSVPPPLACDLIEEYLQRTFDGSMTTLIGHNIGFDVAFLRKVAFLGGRSELKNISHRMIDTHTILKVLMLQGKIPDTATSSDGAFNHFNIKPNASQRHTALHDANLTRILFQKLFEMF